ncbi:AfsR/SARP family transcriptional regulator [Nocardiopsis xinjiangensis]|uniref:AfsR/SARP family transcriptional regulator n=1 Tax=Nocardiopsis xinjiangensis TaxID=124285 RepID=UPI00034D62E5|nr:BTAD domain-containing putative transcriptional regulator [Nocardiopsis xinjiangensis]
MSLGGRAEPQVRVGLLGRLTVEAGGRPLLLRGNKRRALLATLLLHAGRTVSAEVLADRMWGRATEGKDRRGALQVHVARLRALFTENLGSPFVLGEDGGYRVELREEECDLLRLRALVSAARDAGREGDHRACIDLYARSLELWRGPVLVDVPGRTLQEEEVAPLTEELLDAAEEGCAAALARGENEQVAVRTRDITADHPEREPLARMRMAALHRCGRRSEALRVYERTRAALAERRGAEPGDDLCSLYRAVLLDDHGHGGARIGRRAVDAGPEDPAPAGAGSGAPASHTHRRSAVPHPRDPEVCLPLVSTPAPAPRCGCGAAPWPAAETECSQVCARAHTHGPTPGRTTPHLPEPRSTTRALSVLPAAPGPVVGRNATLIELERLADPYGDRPRPVLLRGPVGSDASALALHWAHSVLDAFPDGQLYVDLCDAEGAPRRPADVQRRLLSVIDPGTADRPPRDTEEGAARIRGALAGRRVLVLLDHARSGDQVRPLLPGSGCATVVVSRSWLTDLLVRDGVRAVEVGPLGTGDAARLLATLLGREPGPELHTLARVCGGLPLVLRMAAAWLRTHPGHTVSDLVRVVEGVDPARARTPVARMASVMNAGPVAGRRDRGEVPAAPGSPGQSVGDTSYVRLSPG